MALHREHVRLAMLHAYVVAAFAEGEHIWSETRG